MKKRYYLLISTIALMTASCENIAEEIRPITIEVSQQNLTFTQDSLTQTILVSATDGVAWQISYSESWLTVDYDISSENDTTLVTVTAEAYNVDETRTGRIVFTGEGAANVTVRVTQIGDIPMVPEPEIIWDRSARSRLNLKGRVKTVSVLYNPLIFAGYNQVNDAQFDKNGNLTGFASYGGYSGDMFYTATYDSQNRLATFTQSFDGGKAVAEFHYGDHGVYIPTSTLLYDLSYSVYTYNELWIPKFIKNLESITFERTGSDPGEMVYEIDRENGTGTLSGTSDHDLTIEGDFVTLVISHYPGFNDNFNQYEFNAENGNLINEQTGIIIGNPMDNLTYNDDYLNTLAGNISDYAYDQYTCSYNENSDLAAFDSNDDSYDYTITYEYDSMGNWIKAVKTQNGEETVIERTITYW